MKKMELIRQRRKTEHRRGDIRKACELSNVTPVVFQSAMKKNSIEDLTSKELIVLRNYLEILDERKREIENLRESLAYF